MRFTVIHRLPEKGKYTYFSCLRRRNCTLPYINAEVIEQTVAAQYRFVQLTSEEIEEIKTGIRTFLEEQNPSANSDVDRQKARLKALMAEWVKLVRAYYAEVIPLDLFGTEQARI